MDHLIGVDLGTTGGKAILVNAEGAALATSWVEYPMSRPRADWAENDPDDWVRATQTLVRDVVTASGVPVATIRGLSVVAQRDPLVLLDEAGEVLTPAISWLDRRDQHESDALYDHFGRSYLTSVTGVVPVPGLPLPNLVWTRTHLPDVWRRTRHALFVKDYVIFRLTGEIATDFSTPSRSVLNDYQANDWSESICAAAGIPVEILPEVRYGAWEPRASLDRQAANRLGLAPGTVLAAGGGDDQSATLGSGVIEAGDLSAGTGTASCWRLVSATGLADPAGRADLSPHVVPNRYLYEMTIAGTGLSLRWFRDNFGATVTDGTAPVSTYDALVEEAMLVPPGADGLIFFPYLDGSRLPYFNADASGVFFGIHPGHRPAHFVRAILEGVAYQYPPLIAMLGDYVGEVRNFTLVDGEARSGSWNAIKADVIGRPIHTTRTIEAAAVGSAILAGVAADVFRDIPAAVAALVATGEIVEPDPARSVLYKLLRGRYDAVYRHLDLAFHDAKASERREGAVKEGAIGTKT
jgi:xylulokinase